MSVRMEQLCPHWTDFHESLYLKNFQKYAGKIQRPLKSDENNGAFVEDMYTFMIIFRRIIFKIRNVF